MDAPMVQMIENHAEIRGDLLSIERDTARAGFVTMRIAVEHANDVGGSPNFFAHDVGNTIAIMAPADSAMAATATGPIRLRVKKTGLDTSFAEALLPGAD